MKKCSNCKIKKNYNDFSVETSSKDSYQSKCKPCFKKYWVDNRKAHNAASAKSMKKHRFTRYGITEEIFLEMLTSQNENCKICGKKEFSKTKLGDTKRLSIDHCHKTGKVRGLLCSNCNKGIGLFFDDPLLLEKAIAYLKS